MRTARSRRPRRRVVRRSDRRARSHDRVHRHPRRLVSTLPRSPGDIELAAGVLGRRVLRRLLRASASTTTSSARAGAMRPRSRVSRTLWNWSDRHAAGRGLHGRPRSAACGGSRPGTGGSQSASVRHRCAASARPPRRRGRSVRASGGPASPCRSVPWLGRSRACPRAPPRGFTDRRSLRPRVARAVAGRLGDARRRDLGRPGWAR